MNRKVKSPKFITMNENPYMFKSYKSRRSIIPEAHKFKTTKLYTFKYNNL